MHIAFCLYDVMIVDKVYLQTYITNDKICFILIAILCILTVRAGEERKGAKIL